MSCLLLAGKVEETPKKSKDVLKQAKSLLSDHQFAKFGSDPRVMRCAISIVPNCKHCFHVCVVQLTGLYFSCVNQIKIVSSISAHVLIYEGICCLSSSGVGAFVTRITNTSRGAELAFANPTSTQTGVGGLDM